MYSLGQHVRFDPKYAGFALTNVVIQVALWNTIRKKIGMVPTAIIGCALQAIGSATVPFPAHFALTLPSVSLISIGDAFGACTTVYLAPSVLIRPKMTELEHATR